MKQSKTLTFSLNKLMKTDFIRKSILGMSLMGLSLVTVTGVHAKEGDLQQELKVAAVSQKADIKNNQVIFFGPVNVTQGTININADQLRAFSEESGGKKTMIATGNPATFSQELDDGRIGTASANEIKYELSTSILTLKGNAKLDQAGSQVTGNLISYNIDKQQLIAESTGEGKDRVITIFQPENYPDLNKENEELDNSDEAPIENNDSLDNPDADATDNAPNNVTENQTVTPEANAVETNTDALLESVTPQESDIQNSTNADITTPAAEQKQ